MSEAAIEYENEDFQALFKIVRLMSYGIDWVMVIRLEYRNGGRWFSYFYPSYFTDGRGNVDTDAYTIAREKHAPKDSDITYPVVVCRNGVVLVFIP